MYNFRKPGFAEYDLRGGYGIPITKVSNMGKLNDT